MVGFHLRRKVRKTIIEFDGFTILSSKIAGDCSETKSTKSEDQSRKKRQLFRFDLTRNEVHSNHEISKEELQVMDLWYTKYDYRAFKLAASATARRMTSSSYARAVESTYMSCFGEENGEDESRLRVEDSDRAQYAVGLEQIMIPRIGNDQTRRREDLLEAILKLQKESSSKSLQGGLCLSERVRTQSERMTCASQEFARRLAQLLL